MCLHSYRFLSLPDNHMNMIDKRYMSDKSDIWGQMGFGDRRTFLILESLLQKKILLGYINT